MLVLRVLFVAAVCITIGLDALGRFSSYRRHDLVDRLYGLYLLGGLLLSIYDGPGRGLQIVITVVILTVINLRLRGIFFDR